MFNQKEAQHHMFSNSQLLVSKGVTSLSTSALALRRPGGTALFTELIAESSTKLRHFCHCKTILINSPLCETETQVLVHF